MSRPSLVGLPTNARRSSASSRPITGRQPGSVRITLGISCSCSGNFDFRGDALSPGAGEVRKTRTFAHLGKNKQLRSHTVPGEELALGREPSPPPSTRGPREHWATRPLRSRHPGKKQRRESVATRRKARPEWGAVTNTPVRIRPEIRSFDAADTTCERGARDAVGVTRSCGPSLDARAAGSSSRRQSREVEENRVLR